MAANKQQGSYFGLFWPGQRCSVRASPISTAGSARHCWRSARSVVIGSLFGFMGIKSLEGKTALKANPRV